MIASVHTVIDEVRIVEFMSGDQYVAHAQLFGHFNGQLLFTAGMDIRDCGECDNSITETFFCRGKQQRAVDTAGEGDTPWSDRPIGFYLARALYYPERQICSFSFQVPFGWYRFDLYVVSLDSRLHCLS